MRLRVVPVLTKNDGVLQVASGAARCGVLAPLRRARLKGMAWGKSGVPGAAPLLLLPWLVAVVQLRMGFCGLELPLMRLAGGPELPQLGARAWDLVNLQGCELSASQLLQAWHLPQGGSTD